MPWTDRLRPASFRGVPFKVLAHELGAGRELAVHTFVRREQPYIEDMGRSPRRYKLDAFVLGDDYMAQRDALLAAVETPGAGDLVHPYFGTQRVRCTGETRVGEDAREGRMARLTLEFVEAGALDVPEATDDPAAALAASVEALQEAAAESFTARAVTAGVPAFVVEAPKTQWERLVEKLRRLDLRGALQEVAAFQRDLERLTDDVLLRMGEPGSFAEDVQALLSSIDRSAGSRLQSFRLYSSLFGDRAPRRRGTSPLERTAQENVDALAELTGTGILDGATSAAVAVDWPSREDAIAARELLLAELAALEELASALTYPRLAELRARIVGSLPPPDRDLPELAMLTLRAPTPGLVLAYRLYDDVAREADILARNRVRHPGFIPAGDTLQVLVDA